MGKNRGTTTGAKVHLTSGRLIAQNTLFNLIGQGTPMIIAFFSIPLLIKGMGTARFGVLTLAWAVIGYFSFFDFGLGRAVTKLVSERLCAEDRSDLPAIVGTSLFLMFIFGIGGSLILGVASNSLVLRVLKVPAQLNAEMLFSFYLLAATIPVVVTTAGLRGILEAHQEFKLVNIVRIAMGAFSYLAPLCVLPFSKNLFAVVVVLVIGRCLAWGIHLFLCFSVAPDLMRGITISRNVVRPVLSFGGWMTITNVVGPLMSYLDRFFIGAILSVSAVAYYTTPYELVTRLWIIPGGLLGVLFPAFAASYVQDRAQTTRLFVRSLKYLLLILFPIILVINAFAHEGLALWINPEFASKSSVVFQLLAIGVFVNSFGQASIVLIQSIGRPDLSAKLHFVELPLYLFALWGFTHSFGINGAAFAWTARIACDAIVLFLMAKHFLVGMKLSLSSGIAVLVFFVPGCFVFLFTGVISKIIFLFFEMLIFGLVAWFIILSLEERETIQSRLTALRLRWVGEHGE